MANSKEKNVFEIVKHYFRGDSNFISAEIQENVIRIEMHDINDGEEYHQTLIPYILKRGIADIIWMYGEEHSFIIICR